MKITWVTRSFLDYRLPVYEKLNQLCGDNLSVIFFSEVVPERCQKKLGSILKERSIGLTGELRLTGRKMQQVSSIMRGNIRIPFQPGLIKMILKTEPDIIITDGFFQWTYGPLLLRTFFRIPHIMCYEGTEHTERNAGKLRAWYRKLASRAMDHIVCNGVLSKKYVKGLGFPLRKISLGNMAADTEGFEKKSTSISRANREQLKHHLGIKGKTILFIGRLVPLKGVDKLLEVWNDTLKTNNELTLLIVGDGPQKEDLINYCIMQEMDNVRFTGGVSHDSLPNYLAISDVFIIPTLQDNWSLVVPEAMSCKLPIVCSRYNGCWPELVTQDNGWVFDPLSRESFKNTMKQVMYDTKRWQTMGSASLEIVQGFTPEKIAKGLHKNCKRIVEEKSV